MILDTGRARVALLAIAAALAAAGCDSGGTTTEPDPDDDVTGVQISAPSNALTAGETMQLTATVQPASAPQTVAWSTSDDQIALVDATGLVTGAGAGTATISAASTADPTKTASVQITVTCAVLTSADVSNGGSLPPHSCWLAQSALSVNSGTLTIGEGATISFAPNAYLVIGSNGSLNAVGTAQAPITLTSADPAGQWRGVNFDGSRSASNVLRYVTVENGGSGGWSGAAYSTAAVLLQDDALVDIQNSTITGSGGSGITAYGGSELVFENNTLSENAYAAWMHPDNAGAISATNTFSNNTADVVRVAFNNTNAVSADTEWQGLDVPYEIQHRFYVDAALTLEPGATLAFLQDRSMIVRPTGSLRAVSSPVGEPEPEVVFQAAAPGIKWKGIHINSESVENRIVGARLTDGGSQAWTGVGDSRAMVYLTGRSIISNSTFENSEHYALYVTGAATPVGVLNNVIRSNARAVRTHPRWAGDIGHTSNTYESNADDRIWVAFGNTDAVDQSSAWQPATTYYVTTRIYVRDHLFIGGGTTVEFAQNASLIVAEEGSLGLGISVVAEPAVLRGAQDVPGYWQGIRISSADADRNLFVRARIINAGSGQWFGGANSVAALYVDPDGYLSLEEVSFEKSGALAATVSGTIICGGDVDDGGHGFYFWPGASVTGPCQ